MPTAPRSTFCVKRVLILQIVCVGVLILQIVCVGAQRQDDFRYVTYICEDDCHFGGPKEACQEPDRFLGQVDDGSCQNISGKSPKVPAN